MRNTFYLFLLLRSHAVLTSSVQFCAQCPSSQLLLLLHFLWPSGQSSDVSLSKAILKGMFLCLDDNATRPLVSVWQLSLTCRSVTGLTCRGVTSRSCSFFLFSLKKQPRLLISSHGLIAAIFTLWVHFRTYSVACMVYSAINSSDPAYLCELLHIYTLSRTLRSSSDTRKLKIKQYKRKAFALSLALAGPHIWNSLPPHNTSDITQSCHRIKRSRPPGRMLLYALPS